MKLNWWFWEKVFILAFTMNQIEKLNRIVRKDLANRTKQRNVCDLQCFENFRLFMFLSLSFRIPSFAHIPLLFRAFAFFSSRLCRTRWSGPWDKEYTSGMSSLTSRLPRPFDEHFFEHLEPGSVPLHTITWQWTNTNGWSAMNLKASRLNRCALTEGAAWYFAVLSFGHLINAKS